MTKITLSPDQQEALTTFKEFLRKDQQEISLTGSAGFGKTTLVKELVKQITEMYEAKKVIKQDFTAPTIYITAMTNKAASVLKSNFPEATSLHSALGLQIKNDYKTGNQKLIRGRNYRTLNNVILFIDEATMADPFLIDLVRKTITNSKIIWIGDKHQLDPVKGRQNTLFQQGPRTQVVELTTNHRQRDAEGIYLAAEAVKSALKNNLCPHELKIPLSNCVYSLSQDEFLNKIKSVTEEEWEAGTKILAWKNVTVDQYNRFVDNHLHASGKDRKVLRPGQYVVSAPYIKDGKYLTVGEVVYVEDFLREDPIGASYLKNSHFNLAVTPKISLDDLNFSLEEHTIKDSQGNTLVAKIATDAKRFNSFLKHFKNNWPVYFEIKESTLLLELPYASTVHKSQGSTYKDVFVDISDIYQNKKAEEILRLLYVAISRAKCNVYIYEGLR